MHYELYIDSLFFINFIMNLYLLILVDHSTLRGAGTLRMLAGAAAGAVFFLFPFLGTGPVPFRLAGGIAAGTAGMICIAFPVKSLRMFLKLLERLLLYSFGMGGAMLFLIRILPGGREFMTGAVGLAGAGGAVFLLFRRFRYGTDTEHSLCKAVLFQGERRLTVNALIDSGNSLVEPISGKCVCIVEKRIYDSLQGMNQSTFRAIPYHSIGKKNGIMPGYLLEKLQVELEGMKYTFADVYIAVSREEISGTENAGRESVNMIINPALFTRDKGGSRRKRQNERRNDSESNITGQDSIQNDPQR